MAEKPKGISQETAEAYALLGVPYEGYVEGVGYQSLMTFTIGDCYFQERGCAIPQFVPVMDSSPEMRIQSMGDKHKENFAGEGKDHDLLAKESVTSSGMFLFSPSNEVRKMMGGKASNGGGTSYGLYVAASAGSAWDVYNNFAYNHTSYPTTKGIMKPYSDFAGRNMSKQASKFFRKSTGVKWAGNFGTGLLTFQSGYNYYNGDRSALNYVDGGVGLMGLGNAAVNFISGAGSAAIGPFVALYGGGRLLYDASAGERQQIQDNIMNNRNPIENVYNPTLGF